jgi:hypothetical protein
MEITVISRGHINHASPLAATDRTNRTKCTAPGVFIVSRFMAYHRAALAIPRRLG